MQLDKSLYEEINEYCKLNELKTRDFIHEVLREAFLIKKYGNAPFAFNYIEKKDEQIGTIIAEHETIENSIVNKDASKVFDEITEGKVVLLDTIETSSEKNIPDLVKTEEDIKPKKKRRLS